MVLRDQNTFPGMFTQEERYIQAEGSGSWRVTCKVPQPTRSSEGDNDNQRYTLVTETATESTKPLFMPIFPCPQSCATPGLVCVPRGPGWGRSFVHTGGSVNTERDFQSLQDPLTHQEHTLPRRTTWPPRGGRTSVCFAPPCLSLSP